MQHYLNIIIDDFANQLHGITCKLPKNTNLQNETPRSLFVD